MLATFFLALYPTQWLQTALTERATVNCIFGIMVLQVKSVLLACGKPELFVFPSFTFDAFLTSQIYSLGTRLESLAASERLTLVSSLKLGLLRFGLCH